MVSSFSITGEQNSFGDETINYFNRINNMNLNPSLVGFGISNKETFNLAWKTVAFGNRSAYISNRKLMEFQELSLLFKTYKLIII